MVTRFLMLSVVATMAMTAQAQKAELTFGVSGICGMCENRIESAFDKKGIVAVDYDLLVQVKWSQPIEYSPSVTETNQS